MTRKRPVKIDFKKTHKDLYTATARIKEVRPGKGVFLSVTGQGEPGGTAFQSAIEKLYSVAYTLKFQLLGSGVLDFGVGALECVWLVTDPKRTPRSEWGWQLALRIPDAVKASHIAAARKAIRAKRGIETDDVRRTTFSEGLCLQVMHLGPYDALPRTYAALTAHAQERGWVPAEGCRELYLSNPQRVAPAKLKTIVRMPVRRSSRGDAIAVG